MNRPLIFFVFLVVLCGGCSKPRIDATTDDSFEQSLGRVRASLPESRRPTFDASLSTIGTILASSTDFRAVDVGVASMQAAVKRALNGKTGDEVIAYADDLKNGRQHPQLAVSDEPNASRNSQRPPLVLGDNPNTSGNSFWRSVSAQFGEPELRRLYSQLNGPDVKSKLQRYVCPNSLPSFTFTVVLWYEGPYQERGVRLQMTPPLYREDGRVENGVGYQFEQAVKALDKGPPIDYGYVHPLDGSKAAPQPPVDSYSEPKTADCNTSGLAPQQPALASVNPERLSAHVEYLRGNRLVTVWVDAAGLAHLKDGPHGEISRQRPLSSAESDSLRVLAREVGFCNRKFGVGDPLDDPQAALEWIKLADEIDGIHCFASFYVLDLKRMPPDEIREAQRVLRKAVALRQLFPEAYAPDEKAADEAFLAAR
jgi:hypothetical protein